MSIKTVALDRFRQLHSIDRSIDRESPIGLSWWLALDSTVANGCLFRPGSHRLLATKPNRYENGNLFKLHPEVPNPHPPAGHRSVLLAFVGTSPHAKRGRGRCRKRRSSRWPSSCGLAAARCTTTCSRTRAAPTHRRTGGETPRRDGLAWLAAYSVARPCTPAPPRAASISARAPTCNPCA